MEREKRKRSDDTKGRGKQEKQHNNNEKDNNNIINSNCNKIINSIYNGKTQTCTFMMAAAKTTPKITTAVMTSTIVTVAVPVCVCVCEDLSLDMVGSESGGLEQHPAHPQGMQARTQNTRAPSNTPCRA